MCLRGEMEAVQWHKVSLQQAHQQDKVHAIMELETQKFMQSLQKIFTVYQT